LSKEDTRSVTVMYFVSLNGLKKGGTRGEGRQGKIRRQDYAIRSYHHEIMGMTVLPQYLSSAESRRLCY